MNGPFPTPARCERRTVTEQAPKLPPNRRVRSGVDPLPMPARCEREEKQVSLRHRRDGQRWPTSREPVLERPIYVARKWCCASQRSSDPVSSEFRLVLSPAWPEVILGIGKPREGRIKVLRAAHRTRWVSQERHSYRQGARQAATVARLGLAEPATKSSNRVQLLRFPSWRQPLRGPAAGRLAYASHTLCRVVGAAALPGLHCGFAARHRTW